MTHTGGKCMPALAAITESPNIKQKIDHKGGWTLLTNEQPIKLEQKTVSVRDLPDVLRLLLKDRTTRRNILWATNSYEALGKGFQPSDVIKPDVITQKDSVILPRVLKAKEEQKSRTKGKAEVFTPVWVIKKQNDLVNDEYKDRPLNQYLETMWLEITCGEAPYMCTRYDTVTGEAVALKDRVGFVDRKLQRLSKDVDDKQTWTLKARKAYRYSYGYEYQGDSLFLARENLIQTYIDYYVDKFGENPSVDELKKIAKIISFNVFQMDGLSYTLPAVNEELGSVKVNIRDWKKRQMVSFESLTQGKDEK